MFFVSVVFDWDEARGSGALDTFVYEVQVRLAPLLVGVYDDPDQMSKEIKLVAGLLTDAAEKLLHHVQPWRKAKWRDDTRSRLCAQSRAVVQHGRRLGDHVRGHYLLLCN